MDGSITYSAHNSTTEQLLQQLNRFRMTGSYCNAVLTTTDGGNFRVHKAAMSLCSNYFRILFTNSLGDDDSGDGPLSKTYYHVPDISSSVLNSIINFAYSGIADINMENVNELLPAADQFNVLGLVEECVNFMLKNMTLENCIGIWQFGKEYFMPRLEHDARKFILKHFIDVSMNSDEFLSLKLKFLKDILMDDDLNASSEQSVWAAIERWCKHENEIRQRMISSLVPCVRLALLSINEFENIMDDPRVFKSERCRQYISMVSKYILNEREEASKMAQEIQALHMFKPRHPHETIVVIGGYIFDNSDYMSFEAYDCRADKWRMIQEREVRSLPHNVPTAMYNGNIFFIGGRDGNSCMNSCSRLDISSFTYQEICPMHEKRCFHSAVVLNGKIYAIAGFDGSESLQTVEQYDPSHNQWSYIASMNAKRTHAGASSLRNRIFVVGGFNGSDYLQSAECYYAEYDQWFILVPMLKCRAGAGCVTIDNSFYVIGGTDDGENSLNSVEKYCIKDRQWIPVKPMKTGRHCFALSILEGRIYVMGGRNNEGMFGTDRAEYFDPVKYQWTSIAPMRFGRCYFSACTLSDVQGNDQYVKEDRNLLKDFIWDDSTEGRSNNR